MPDISVITVNYNGLEDTCELIRSIRQNLSLSHEIIVIDNGSLQNEASKIHACYPEVKCIRSEKNLGFAGGNNLGIREAVADYLLFINNDTYITDDSLHYLYETLSRNPHIGAVSPKIKFAQPPHHIQFAGYTPLSGITLRNHLIGFDEEDKGQYDISCVTPYLHGAAMLVRREAIRKAGEMPVLYFLYYEEIEWCVRIRKAGYELYYDPRSTVYHKESKTTGADSPLKNYYLTRNRLLYAWRNLKGWKKWASLFYQYGIANPKNITVFLFRGKYRQAMACINGSLAFIGLKNKKAS